MPCGSEIAMRLGHGLLLLISFLYIPVELVRWEGTCTRDRRKDTKET